MSILGVVVRVRPQDREAVVGQLSAFEGLDVAIDAQDGRLVVIIEDTQTVAAADTMAAIATFPLVLNTSLVYEYSGPDAPTATSASSDNDFHYQAWRGPVGQNPRTNAATGAATPR